MKFHPAAQILSLCLLVVSMQAMTLGPLIMTAGMVLLGAFAFSRQKFIQLLRRTRWIILSLLLIYAYTTPGQPLFDPLGSFSPSSEGIADGMLQLFRLLAALAGLAILLDHLQTKQLIAGLYFLFAPLQWMGLSRDRIAVRLALTLEYTEAEMLRDTKSWQDRLCGVFEQHGDTEGITNDSSGVVCQTSQMAGCPTRILIELPVCRFMFGDVLLLGSALLILVMTMR